MRHRSLPTRYAAHLLDRLLLPGMLRSPLLLPIIGQKSGITPVFLGDLLYDYVNVVRALPRNPHHRIRHFLDQGRFLVS